MTDKWISVKDKLPENDKNVLVFCPHWCDDEWTSQDGIDIAYYDTVWKWTVPSGQNIDQYVLFWMPLPEPPK